VDWPVCTGRSPSVARSTASRWWTRRRSPPWRDATILYPTRFGLGFMKPIDNLAHGGVENSVLLAEEAFGHAGMGGSLGFADPKARLSLGYTMNKQGGGLGMNTRGQALVDAVYRTLGYRQADGGGIWFA
jgi:CubicO group peptidase (beta-lactamase class C family)